MPRACIPWPRCSTYRRGRRGHSQHILLDYPRRYKWTFLLVRTDRTNFPRRWLMLIQHRVVYVFAIVATVSPLSNRVVHASD